MKFSIKPVLWIKDKDKENKCPIAFSISGGGRTYSSTDIKVNEDFWDNATRKIKKGFPNYDIHNNKISKKIADAEREILNRELQGETLTVNHIKEILDRDKSSSKILRKIKTTTNFISFYHDHIEYIKNKSEKKDKDGYYKHFKAEYNSLINFAGDSIKFKDITVEFLEQYEMGLIKTNIKPTTLHTKMKRLGEIINKAIKRKLIHPDQVDGYKYPKYEKPERHYLTLDEIQKIWELIEKGALDNDPALKKVACFFLIECNSGIRFSDWKKFIIEKLIEKRNFKVRTTKTNAPVYLPLDDFPSLARVVDYIKANKIVFDLTEQYTNRLLKILGKYEELKISIELSTHVGRHTFGTLLGAFGYPLEKIAEAMGISAETAKVYVHQTRRDFADEVKKYGGW